jgi:hypothetical protein
LLTTLEQSENACYILDGQLRFIYCNSAWDRFAASNDAPELLGESVIGATLMRYVPGVLTGAYEQAFQSVRETGRVWSKTYECSSPGQFQRISNTDSHVETQGLVPRVQFTRGDLAAQEPQSPSPEMYFTGGVVAMCAHCRCSRRLGSAERWDFVPEYLQLKGPDLLNVSQGLCSTCQAYFYPDL